MKRVSIIAGFLFTALMAAGCAGSDVENQQTNAQTDAVPKPERVFVYDFASTTSGVAPNSAISEMKAHRTTPQTPEEIELGRQLGKMVAAHLINELNDRGIPAISAGAGPVPVPGDAIIRGEFISVDEGSRLKRVVIGFGAGSAELKTLAEAYVITTSGPVPLGSAEVEAEGGKLPGMVVSLGVGSAATIAASGASKVFTEAGPEGMDGTARRTAEKLAELMVAGYKRRGWM
jgi:hypothetical protein